MFNLQSYSVQEKFFCLYRPRILIFWHQHWKKNHIKISCLPLFISRRSLLFYVWIEITLLFNFPPWSFSPKRPNLFPLHTLLFVSPLHPAFPYPTHPRNIYTEMINISQHHTSWQTFWDRRVQYRTGSADKYLSFLTQNGANSLTCVLLNGHSGIDTSLKVITNRLGLLFIGLKSLLCQTSRNINHGSWRRYFSLVCLCMQLNLVYAGWVCTR